MTTSARIPSPGTAAPTTYKYVYLWPGGQDVEQFRYDPSVGNFNPPTPPTHTSSFPGDVYKLNSSQTAGGSLAISSNGATNPVLWGVGYNGAVHAFNGADVSQPELWDSSTNSSRDGLGSVGHFQFPTVAAGRLFVPTGSQSIAVYGLRWLMTDPGVGHAIGRADSGGWSASTPGTDTELPPVRPLHERSSRPDRTSPPGNCWWTTPPPPGTRGRSWSCKSGTTTRTPCWRRGTTYRNAVDRPLPVRGLLRSASPCRRPPTRGPRGVPRLWYEGRSYVRERTVHGTMTP